MKRHNGFTLIELVLVLVIIGILAAVAIPRLPVGSDFESSLQARNLAGLLRLAQLRAMNDPQALQSGAGTDRCGVIAVTRNGVSVSQGCSSAILLSKEVLAESHQEIWLGAELPVASNKSLPFILQFGKEPEKEEDKKYLSETSRLGQPFVNGTRLTDTLTISLGGQTVLIEPEGYIHVAR